MTSVQTQTTVQTIETTATVDENGVIHLAPLAVLGVAPGEVRLLVMVAPVKAVAAQDYTLEELSEKQWRQAMQNSSALAFLADPAEDIYTLEDGEPMEWDKP